MNGLTRHMQLDGGIPSSFHTGGRWPVPVMCILGTKSGANRCRRIMERQNIWTRKGSCPDNNRVAGRIDLPAPTPPDWEIRLSFLRSTLSRRREAR